MQKQPLTPTQCKPPVLVSQPAAQAAPFMWSLHEWNVKAPQVFPFSAPKARRLFREHAEELVNHGALLRVGRVLVVVGEHYLDWLTRQTDTVLHFKIAANTPRALAKRKSVKAKRRRTERNRASRVNGSAHCA